MTKKEYLLIFILWTIATVLNINKAFHIDDVFHIEFAQCLQNTPFHPMSGMINWADNSAFNFHSNQPPLYFYLLAFAGKIMGYSEISLHLFQSIFSFFAIVFFYKIAVLFSQKYASFLTALFVMNPAFLLNQNLMIDVPLLSLNLIFFYLLLKPSEKYIHLNYCLVGFLLGLGLLMKYSNLPLVAVLFFVLILQKRYRLLYILLIPIGMLVLWNLLIYVQHGVCHLFSRETSELFLSVIFRRMKSFIICIGAISPFAIIFIATWLRKYKYLKYIYLACALCSLIGLPVLVYSGIISEYRSSIALRVVFFANGLLLLFASILDKKTIKITEIEPKTRSLRWSYGIRMEFNFKVFQTLKINTNTMILLLWIGFMGGFFLFLAPFMATRHMLLILPAILFLCIKYLDFIPNSIRLLTLGLTAFLGLSLGISDWNYANIYREQASKIKKMLPANSNLWTAGHWGWQWYSKKEGMKQYESDYSNLKIGDYLVYPINIDHQRNNDSIYSVIEKEIIIQPKFGMFFCTAKAASFYSCDYPKLPWFFSKSPIDTIRIFRVVERPDLHQKDPKFYPFSNRTLNDILNY